ncbi:MAG: cyclic nucleotide-binding domain-containing protein, partial [Actinobacteria bacterium]|nr:cyclic nucleotide-binding domain-containing protein [Actinomycetota bacterium]
MSDFQPQAESDVAFPRLDEAQMATMIEAGRSERVEAGAVLFSPGDLDYELTVVVSGCVEVVDDAGTPEERVLVSYGPRQFAGELNLITAEPALLTTRVTAPSEVVFIDREALRTVVSRDSRLGDLIMNALVARRATLIENQSGARLIGSGGDPYTRELREFLTRNRVPHRFIDLDRDASAAASPDGRPLEAGDVPMLVSGDKVLAAPTILEAATALNLRAPNKTAKVAWDT